MDAVWPILMVLVLLAGLGLEEAGLVGRSTTPPDEER
jgi:hypothetical protein